MKKMFLVFLCITVATLVSPAEQKRDLDQESPSLQLKKVRRYSFTDRQMPIRLLRWNPKDPSLVSSASKTISYYPTSRISSLGIINSETGKKQTINISDDIFESNDASPQFDWLNQQLVLGFYKNPFLQIVASDTQVVFETQNYPDDYGVRVLNCHPTEQKIVFAALDKVYIWDRVRDKYDHLHKDLGLTFTLEYAPTGSQIAMGGLISTSENGIMYLLDPRSNKRVHTQNFDIADEDDLFSNIIAEDNTGVRRITWNRDGALLAIAQKRLLHLWDSRSRSILHTVKFESELNDLCWNQDGFLASGSSDGVVRLWDPSTNKCIAASLVLNNGSVNALDWSSMTDHLAVGDSDGKVSIFALSKENTDDFYSNQPEGENQ